MTPAATGVPASPPSLFGHSGSRRAPRAGPLANRLLEEDAAVHRWYRFVLSFPPHLVRDYLDDFAVRPGGVVLDPFCGTGTTLVECRKLGVGGIGLEAMPMAHFASSVKTDWNPGATDLWRHARRVAAVAHRLEKRGSADGLRQLPEPARRLLIKDSISALPCHRALALADAIEQEEASGAGAAFARHERLALAKTLVEDAGNLHFGPEVGVRRIREDAPVIEAWLSRVREIVSDLERLPGPRGAFSRVLRADARNPSLLDPASVDAIITSPPYPNEKDYSRTTRLETVFLGFARDMTELRSFKKTLVRSNTRSVYRADDDDRWVRSSPAVQQIARTIEERRVDLGKTSGFERNYHRVALLYFGGMARHFAALRRALKPGAMLAYVVGDQASFFRVMIRTGGLLGRIAESLGYEVVRTDLFRTRLATATREQLREEVLVLRWPGGAS